MEEGQGREQPVSSNLILSPETKVTVKAETESRQINTVKSEVKQKKAAKDIRNRCIVSTLKSPSLKPKKEPKRLSSDKEVGDSPIPKAAKDIRNRCIVSTLKSPSFKPKKEPKRLSSDKEVGDSPIRNEPLEEVGALGVMAAEVDASKKQLDKRLSVVKDEPDGPELVGFTRSLADLETDDFTIYEAEVVSPSIEELMDAVWKRELELKAIRAAAASPISISPEEDDVSSFGGGVREPPQAMGDSLDTIQNRKSPKTKVILTVVISKDPLLLDLAQSPTAPCCPASSFLGSLQDHEGHGILYECPVVMKPCPLCDFSTPDSIQLKWHIHSNHNG